MMRLGLRHNIARVVLVEQCGCSRVREADRYLQHVRLGVTSEACPVTQHYPARAQQCSGNDLAKRPTSDLLSDMLVPIVLESTVTSLLLGSASVMQELVGLQSVPSPVDCPSANVVGVHSIASRI